MNGLKKAWETSRTFLQEVVAEMRKVTFPGRQEVIGTTVVVIVTSVIFAVFLFAADQLIVWGYNGLAKVFG
jgi:preprotein translocase subunit SecE